MKRFEMQQQLEATKLKKYDEESDDYKVIICYIYYNLKIFIIF